MLPPSGEQFVLSSRSSVAVVTEVGATLRHLELDAHEVLFGFREDELCRAGKGQVLSPWPNRLEDGRYVFGGVAASAAIDDPAHGAAIHGLVRWLPWKLVERTDDTLELSLTLHPSPGYPFRLRHLLTYTLRPGELAVSVRVANDGEGDAPFAIGFHPYLLGGADGLDAGRLSVPARTHLRLDERGLPRGSEPVASSPFARISEGVWPTRIGSSPTESLAGVILDDCFGGLESDADGRWRVRFSPGGGAPERVLWAEQPFAYVMCFTADNLPGPDARRGVAVEPMTCPPNALRTGDGVIVLGPGEHFVGTFGIALEGAG